MKKALIPLLAVVILFGLHSKASKSVTTGIVTTVQTMQTDKLNIIIPVALPEYAGTHDLALYPGMEKTLVALSPVEVMQAGKTVLPSLGLVKVDIGLIELHDLGQCAKSGEKADHRWMDATGRDFNILMHLQNMCVST